MNMRGTLVVCADIDSLYREAVWRITTALARAGERQKVVSLALAGGKTPRALYQWLAREEF
ncbi:MAG: 6-phosphogluconolactonase, partial [Candidatus Acidiferrales bacterium]